MKWYQVLIVVFFAFFLGWVTVHTAHSATMTTRCVVGNQDCFVIRAGCGSLSAEDRMGLVNDRLAGVLGYAKSGDVNVQETAKGDSAVFIGHTLVVTATLGDSVANGGLSTRALASIWSKNLASALQ